LHAASPEEAIYRMCNSVSADFQNEVRNQLASTMAWIIIQQLVYLEKAGQRVPVLTIVHGTQAIKNIIRDNKLHLMDNAIQNSRATGMFMAESYLTDYLNNRSNFSVYDKIFRPSGELPQNIFYQSPLMEVPRIKQQVIKQDRRKASQPIVGVPVYSDEKLDSILDISDDMPLDNIIEKLNNNSE
jgi:hypothetical protein